MYIIYTNIVKTFFVFDKYRDVQSCKDVINQIEDIESLDHSFENLSSLTTPIVN